MKKTLIILIILSSNICSAQDYFFEFVDGWVNNYCIEAEGSYLYLGLGLLGAPTQHLYLYNELDEVGSLIDQTSFEIDTLSTTSTMLSSQMAIEIGNDNILIVGVFGQDIGAGELYGSLVVHNIEESTFDVITSINVDQGTQFFCLDYPNDSTLLVAGLWGNGTYTHTRIWNLEFDGTERWVKDYEDCDYCTLTPIQILSLSNGNIAYMYGEFEDDFQFTDTQRAIIVIMDGETGDQIGDPILVGDHENYRIWAGGMVEQDGEILVSYTQPYYYDEDGEWQANTENSIYFEKYNLSGDLLASNNLEGEIPDGNSAVNPSIFYDITQMQELDDGNLFLSGTSGFHGLIMKTDQDGNLTWYQQIVPHEYTDNPVAQDTDFYYAAPTSDGGFMMAGKYESDPGGLYPQGIQTAIALKVDEYGCLEQDCQVGIEEVEQNILSIYPNPSSGIFVIELPSYEESSLKIFNAMGEEIMFEDGIIGERYEVDLTNFPQGVYLVQLQVIERSRNAGPSTGSGTFRGVYSSKIIKE